MEWKNRLIFQGGECKSIRTLRRNIISLVNHYSRIIDNTNLIHNIIPPNFRSLPMQITTRGSSLMVLGKRMGMEKIKLTIIFVKQTNLPSSLLLEFLWFFSFFGKLVMIGWKLREIFSWVWRGARQILDMLSEFV
jgi:hypothetical protein